MNPSLAEEIGRCHAAILAEGKALADVYKTASFPPPVGASGSLSGASLPTTGDEPITDTAQPPVCSFGPGGDFRRNKFPKDLEPARGVVIGCMIGLSAIVLAATVLYCEYVACP